MDTLLLYHTSPEPITRIHEHGTFGDFLCFAVRPYYTTCAPDPRGYSLEIPKAQIIEARGFFFHEDADKLDPIVQQVVRMVGCDEDIAEDLLSGVKSLSDIDSVESDADLDFHIQRLQGNAARTLGYRAVLTFDEQGSMYLISMLGHEDELRDVTEEWKQAQETSQDIEGCHPFS